jgi:predicted O-linked N-acetylglucosamine transferase (SPINDLY family)
MPAPSSLPPNRNVPALLDAAIAALNAGDLVAARAHCERVLYLQPKNVDGLHFLGLVLCSAGETDKGLKLLRRAIAFAPRHGAALNNLGNILKDLGQFADALASYDRALAVDPTLAEAHFNAGNALSALGRSAEALDRYDRALAIRPGYVAVLVNRATAQGDLGRFDAALEDLDRAVATAPDFAEAHYNRGNALAALDRGVDAIASYDRALLLDPGHRAALNNRGIALQAARRFDAALASYERVLALDPNDADALNNLGNLRHEQGRIADALEAYDKAVRLRPAVAGPASNLLLLQNYMDEQSPAAALAAHRAWAARIVAPPSAPFPARRPGRLRVGYVSADFRTHSVAYFFEPLLAHHDRAAVETFCYAQGRAADATTERLRAQADHWVPIGNLTDEQVAARVRADGIDILVDLGGHTGNSRLAVFAWRAAPVQVTWLGYPNTTGLTVMDYRLTDAIADPVGTTDPFHTERLVRLDDGFLCYRPPFDAPAVAPTPARERGFVTFGSFNHPAKLADATVAAWSALLARVPDSRLLLKAKAFEDETARRHHMERFVAAGAAADRLDLVGHIDDPQGHLAAYGRIDLALDPFPYNGTTTTCEALWMGVPVVTLAGDRHAGRVGASLLHRAGLDELVAGNRDEYVSLAAALAMDIDRIAALRAGMRDRLSRSPLLDGARFARAVEAAFRGMVAV